MSTIAYFYRPDGEHWGRGFESVRSGRGTRSGRYVPEWAPGQADLGGRLSGFDTTRHNMCINVRSHAAQRDVRDNGVPTDAPGAMKPFVLQVTAVLMEAFLRRHYPDVRVVKVHSHTNIFRCVMALLL